MAIVNTRCVAPDSGVGEEDVFSLRYLIVSDRSRFFGVVAGVLGLDSVVMREIGQTHALWHDHKKTWDG